MAKNDRPVAAAITGFLGNSIHQILSGKLIVHVHVVWILDGLVHLVISQAGIYRLLEQLAIQSVVLVGNRHDWMIDGIVGLEECVGKTLRRNAAGVLRGLRLATVQAVHLAAFSRLDRGDR